MTRVFEYGDVHAREMSADGIASLQALFEQNPEYFLTVNGGAPKPDEARAEFDDLPPPHIPYSRRWFLGLYESSGELAGVAVVVSDLSAAGVWHVALFLLASRLHGTGIARPLFGALESWARRSGACWLRLGVVEANARAVRFWRACGFTPVRSRLGIDTGGRVNDLWVMVKPLQQGTVAEYLALVPRDDPDSTLP